MANRLFSKLMPATFSPTDGAQPREKLLVLKSISWLAIVDLAAKIYVRFVLPFERETVDKAFGILGLLGHKEMTLSALSYIHDFTPIHASNVVPMMAPMIVTATAALLWSLSRRSQRIGKGTRSGLAITFVAALGLVLDIFMFDKATDWLNTPWVGPVNLSSVFLPLGYVVTVVGFIVDRIKNARSRPNDAGMDVLGENGPYRQGSNHGGIMRSMLLELRAA